MSTRRKELFSMRKELIELSAAEAIESGKKSPIVLVLDLSDPLAREMASSIASKEEVDRRIEHSRKQNSDPILIMDCDLEDALQSFANATPSGPANIQRIIDSGQIPVAIFGDGGVSWAGMLLPS
jgi:hypothetical protein